MYQFGIGQRAMLLQTEHGNVLWDLIAYLDEETIQRVSMGARMQETIIMADV